MILHGRSLLYDLLLEPIDFLPIALLLLNSYDLTLHNVSIN